MSLITIIIVIVFVGVAMYLINRYVPMEARLKNMLNIAVIIFVLIWLVVSFLGVAGVSTPDLRLG